ncbi:uncharacterized protein FTOL_13361 [Fusarium torulosum]|uniref:Uncharacterized protein n=1 Tax=Fusarium torulosum TaxID=33205 RepID=A0AAE8MMP8_9HYPO|nr:uncharacterized protein FTOL_13361 [Fusarium torulosum]
MGEIIVSEEVKDEAEIYNSDHDKPTPPSLPSIRKLAKPILNQLGAPG